MEHFWETVFHAIAAMIVLLMVWLAMGTRQLGELSSFDLIVSITIGTVAGASIVDPGIRLDALMAIIVLGLMQMALSWLSVKCRPLNRRIHYQPVVLVEDGQMIKTNLRKARLPVEAVLALLREKGVFDIREVEVAIFEPHGSISVLKKPAYQPLTPDNAAGGELSNQCPAPVIIEGRLQLQVLKNLGFSEEQIKEFYHTHHDELDQVFVAFIDNNRQLHVIRHDVRQKRGFLS